MQILYEHAWFLVVNKPADLLTQAIDGISSVQTELEDCLKARLPSGPNPFIGIPHRLDRVTTGVMVIARNQRALRRLCEQFATRKVSKSYHAIVENRDPPEQADRDIQGTWTDYVRKIPNVAKGEICDSECENARIATLHFRTLASFPGVSQSSLDACEPMFPPSRLVEIELDTGRMHQIRLQFASRGYPVLGDQLYGSRFTWQQGEFWQSPIALHARRIRFHHPQTAELLTFEADYPPAWQNYFSHAQTTK